jgi:hypothetical protein
MNFDELTALDTIAATDPCPNCGQAGAVLLTHLPGSDAQHPWLLCRSCRLELEMVWTGRAWAATGTVRRIPANTPAGPGANRVQAGFLALDPAGRKRWIWDWLGFDGQDLRTDGLRASAGWSR